MKLPTFTADVSKTKYKRVDKKVKPVAAPLQEGVKPSNDRGEDYLSKDRPVDLNLPIRDNNRVTKELFEQMKIGKELTVAERDFLFRGLQQRDLALAFTSEERGLLKPHVEGAEHMLLYIVALQGNQMVWKACNCQALCLVHGEPLA
jgi:hypothetical protein